MKKKLLAILLAAVMVMALLPTAFAADSEPGISIDVDDADLLSLKKTTFTKREWDEVTSDDNYTSTLTKAEAEDFDFLLGYRLPLGLTLTINAYDPENYGMVICHSIFVCGWSDPDGDGVYDRRISVNGSSSILPASTQGPVEGFSPAYGFEFYDERFVNESETVVNPDIEPAVGNLWTIPATIQITSDYLTELFGANSYVQIAVITGETEEDYQYKYFWFLLTGKDEVVNKDETPDETETPAGTFDDVDAKEFYASDVEWAAENGYIKGNDGKFLPNNPLRRNEFFTILGRMADADVDGGTPWYQKAVDWAVENNVSSGDAPEGNITLEQLIVMLYRYEGEPEADTSVLEDRFSDGSDISSWAEDGIAWAVEIGLVNGNADGTLTPGTGLPRWRGAMVLKRYCENVQGEE